MSDIRGFGICSQQQKRDEFRTQGLILELWLHEGLYYLLWINMGVVDGQLSGLVSEFTVRVSEFKGQSNFHQMR